MDGVDGVGKSEQIQRLANALEASGKRACVLREPGGTTLGEALRAALLTADRHDDDALVEALMFMASRRQLVIERIAPRLAEGVHVLLDRSFLATWVYQGLVGGVELSFLEQLARRVHGACWPDRILVLDLDVATATARRGGRARDAFEVRGESYLQRVRAGFRQLAERYRGLVRVVSAAGSREDVAARCRGALADLLEGQA